MPKSTVTNIGKIMLTEADKMSSKSSVSSRFVYVFLFKHAYKLIDIMEDDDDVQNVWHNWDQE